jgi:hypothetical protein
MTDLERWTPPDERDSWIGVVAPVGDLAQRIAGTDFIPTGLRGRVAAVAAAILTGRELHLPPMTALAHIHVVEGRPSLSAEMQRALVLKAGHELRIVETNSTRCVVDARRRGDDNQPTRVIWTMDDARKAGLAGRQNWQRHPRRMLQARATAEACRLVFPDVIAGLPAVAEELQDDHDQSEPAAVPARTARRTRGTIMARPEPARESVHPIVEPWEPPLPPQVPEPRRHPDIPEPEPEEQPPGDQERITPRQLRALHSALSQVGINDRAKRLELIQQYLQRSDLESSKQLTADEATRVLDWLHAGMPVPEEPQS